MRETLAFTALIMLAVGALLTFRAPTREFYRIGWAFNLMGLLFMLVFLQTPPKY